MQIMPIWLSSKCLGAEFQPGKCRGCCADPDESFETNEDHFIPSELQKVVKLRGLKIAHQNIQSLARYIDHLRLLLCEELNCGLQLLTLSETWIKQDISDSDETPGYKLFRKDRDRNNAGVAVFAHNDLLVTRREDLEMDSVVARSRLPKSRSFLIGTFYRPQFKILW